MLVPGPLLRIIETEKLKSYPRDYFIFGKHRNGKPSPYIYGVNHFSRKHREVLRELNYDKQHCLYSWKHTGVIHAKKSIKDLHDIKRQLRHHNLDMVDEYLKGLGVMESGFANTDYEEL